MYVCMMVVVRSATAMAVTVMCGRVGAIVGNVAFGALVDQHCVVPIYMFGALLISESSVLYSVRTRGFWVKLSFILTIYNFTGQQRHKRMTTNATGCRLFLFLRFGIEAKRGVEFHYLNAMPPEFRVS